MISRRSARFLAAVDLPTEGLREHLGTALVASEGDDVVVGDFFGRHFAFRRVARDAVPAGVRQSVEFTSACPAPAQR